MVSDLQLADARHGRAEALLARAAQLMAAGQYSAAMLVARDAIGLYGESLPSSGGQLRTLVTSACHDVVDRLRQRSLAKLSSLPRMTDETARMRLRILVETAPAAWATDLDLFCYIGARIVLSTLQSGTSVHSAYGFAVLGMAIGCMFEERQLGHDLVQWGIRLADQYGEVVYRGKVRSVMGVLTSHWTQPLARSVDYCREAITFGLSCGDRYSPSWAMVASMQAVSAQGAPLEDAYAVAIEHSQYLGAQSPDLLAFSLIYRDFAAYLRNGSDIPNIFCDASFYSTISKRGLAIQQFTYCVKAMFLAVLFGALDEGVEKMRDAERIIAAASGQIATMEYHTAAICLLCAKHRSEPHAAAPWLAKARTHYWVLAAWASHAPETLMPHKLFAEALLAQSAGDKATAAHHFAAAIAAARAAKQLHVAGMANEAAASFYLAQKRPQDALAYLQEAIQFYRRWGALAKVRACERTYRELLAR